MNTPEGPISYNRIDKCEGQFSIAHLLEISSSLISAIAKLDQSHRVIETVSFSF